MAIRTYIRTYAHTRIQKQSIEHLYICTYIYTYMSTCNQHLIHGSSSFRHATHHATHCHMRTYMHTYMSTYTQHPCAIATNSHTWSPRALPCYRSHLYHATSHYKSQELYHATSHNTDMLHKCIHKYMHAYTGLAPMGDSRKLAYMAVNSFAMPHIAPSIFPNHNSICCADTSIILLIKLSVKTAAFALFRLLVRPLSAFFCLITLCVLILFPPFPVFIFCVWSGSGYVYVYACVCLCIDACFGIFCAMYRGSFALLFFCV